MDRSEIQRVYQSKMKSATDKFIGEKVNKDTVDEVRKALNEAAVEAYESIPMAYRDAIELDRPKVDVVINGPEVTVQWLRGLP